MARGNDGTASIYLSASITPLSGNGGPFTVAFWFRRNSVQTNKYLFASSSTGGTSDEAGTIYGFTAGQVEFFASTFTGTNPRTGSGLTISDTNWHHIAYVKTAAGTSAWNKYLDGVETQISASISFTLSASSTKFTVLSDGSHAVWLDGSLAELGIWETVGLNAVQINALAKGGSPMAMNLRPTYYWPLTGSNSPEQDPKVIANSLTLTGSVLSIPHAPIFKTHGGMAIGVPSAGGAAGRLARPGSLEGLGGVGQMAFNPSMGV